MAALIYMLLQIFLKVKLSFYICQPNGHAPTAEIFKLYTSGFV